MEPRAISTLADLPFPRRDVLELLALETDRAEVDADYVGFGHARVERVWLEDEGGRLTPVDDARVLALHSCDLGAPRPDDVELEFFLPEIAPDHSVTALLSAFLAARLAGLRGDEAAIVLAMCNPHGARLAHPAAAGSTPLFYADGDVESWLDPDDRRLRLRAARWRRAGGA